ncbi:MAG TPA: hypothetical protein PKX87_07245 [Alphaproteobacteria bacterium]|nr:hypothetical protein [Alphaproteobacteria bacterium]
MDHHKEGFFRLGRSYAFLGCSLGLGVQGLMDMASGQMLSGGLRGVFSAAAFLLGSADRIHAQDLLTRAPDDFSPPDPIIKEVPVVGRWCHHEWSEQMACQARAQGKPDNVTPFLL